MGRRLAYWSIAFAGGLAIGTLILAAQGKHNFLSALLLAISAANLVVLILQRKGKLPSAEEMRRLTTLFPRG